MSASGVRAVPPSVVRYQAAGETAAQCSGIQDTNDFSIVFKRYALATPKEYLKNILRQINSRNET